MSATPDPAAVVSGARLAVDVGTVRVGLASSDPDGLIATPVATLARATGAKGRLPADIAQVVHEVQERRVGVVYVGLPVHMSGAEGSASDAARAYVTARHDWDAVAAAYFAVYEHAVAA